MGDPPATKMNRRAAALELVREFRAAVLELEPKTLTARETVIALAIATKLKNLAERRTTALRKGANALFTGDRALTALDRAVQAVERVFFFTEEESSDDVVLLKVTNDRFGAKVLSETKALDLLKTKKPSAKKMAMEKPPRPPQPLPHFSGEKFRDLIAKGIISQAEYDACFEAAAPSPTMTVACPSELEEAIAAAALSAACEAVLG
jgi:hypothetical protein